VRANPGLVGLDDTIECSRIDITLLDQDRLEGVHPKLHFGQLRAVVVVVLGHNRNLAD
jgi:hypothetical protein